MDLFNSQGLEIFCSIDNVAGLLLVVAEAGLKDKDGDVSSCVKCFAERRKSCSEPLHLPVSLGCDAKHSPFKQRNVGSDCLSASPVNSNQLQENRFKSVTQTPPRANSF